MSTADVPGRNLHCSFLREDIAGVAAVAAIAGKGLQQGLPARAESDSPLKLLQLGRSALL